MSEDRKDETRVVKIINSTACSCRTGDTRLPKLANGEANLEETLMAKDKANVLHYMSEGGEIARG